MRAIKTMLGGDRHAGGRGKGNLRVNGGSRGGRAAMCDWAGTG